MGDEPGFIIMNQNLCQEKVQVGTLCRKTYADIVLGYEWTNSSIIRRKERQSTVLGTAPYWKRN
jgi:hypothetical protein